MNKSADPGNDRTWLDCLRKPFCHHYARLEDNVIPYESQQTAETAARRQKLERVVDSDSHQADG